MRNMNCRNVRREIEEAGPGDLLSAAVYAHIQSCAACETLSREQSKLQAIISGLGTVEAPGDFDFRLRARLADEGRRPARPFALSNFSLGYRSGAVAMAFLLIGSAFVFVSLRPRLDNSAADGGQRIAQPTTSSAETGPVQDTQDVKASAPVAVGAKERRPDAVEASLGSGSPRTLKRGVGRGELASLKGGNRAGTRDMSSTPAEVLSRNGQVAETYPTAAFPINASYQSLKVSVDNGRGSSRTISLPTVSFGSQRALSQSSSPLIASARGVW